MRGAFAYYCQQFQVRYACAIYSFRQKFKPRSPVHGRMYRKKFGSAFSEQRSTPLLKACSLQSERTPTKREKSPICANLTQWPMKSGKSGAAPPNQASGCLGHFPRRTTLSRLHGCIERASADQSPAPGEMRGKGAKQSGENYFQPTNHIQGRILMTTPQTSFLSEIESDQAIPFGKLAYLRERTRNRLYDFIVSKFMERSRAGFTKADLARRIGKKPEVVTRLLGAPGNWTIDTLSDLLVGICAEELDPRSVSLLNRAPRNHTHPEWFMVEGKSFRPPRSDTSSTNTIVHMICA